MKRSFPTLLSRGLAYGISLSLAGLIGFGSLPSARAELPPQRTFFQLASSNGHGAVMLDLEQAMLVHFREHLYAVEEFQIDAQGQDVWMGNQPQVINTRDLMFDTFFGIRSNGQQKWLKGQPADLDKSGYAPYAAGKTGGTGIVTMVQHVDSLELTHYIFAPQSMGHAGFVMALRVKNTGASAAGGVSVFSLHNFHLGYKRPKVFAEVWNEHVDANGETIEYDSSNGKSYFSERGFAGIIVGRALSPVSHYGTSPAANVFNIVQSTSQDLPDIVNASYADDSVSAFQFNLGDIAPGAEQWAGIVFAHHGDPFAKAQVQGWLDTYVGASNAKQLVDQEIGTWNNFQQNTVQVPAGGSAGDESLARQSAVMLHMGQVRENKTFLRDKRSNDGEPRYTRMGTVLGGPPAVLPAEVEHRGKGAILASLPPGEWTYAWIRDGAYAVSAMSVLGMNTEARDALKFYLDADSGRFQFWNELKDYAMPPYQISLVRYLGFGTEETDFNEYGPNLEFDGFGLFLWALRNYEDLSGDKTLVDGYWPAISNKVADSLVGLIDPATGLIKKDSSIWETHWNGRERSWAYTSITAARGLCDAAVLAARVGDNTRAELYKAKGMAIREAIAAKLTDSSGAIASNAEELQKGSGYWDAAVVEGIAMGLFDPKGQIAQATIAGLDGNLKTNAGVGWSRNDDYKDHGGQDDLSPWGGQYDSAEWVVTDLRGAVAVDRMGDTARADKVIAWIREQSLLNYMAVAETYEENTGVYKFNAPMLGFGAGAYVLALAQKAGLLLEPACGVYYENTGMGGAGGGSSSSSGGGASSSSSGGSGTSSSGNASGGVGGGTPGDEGGCGCRAVGSDDGYTGVWLTIGLGMYGLRRRRSFGFRGSVS